MCRGRVPSDESQAGSASVLCQWQQNLQRPTAEPAWRIIGILCPSEASIQAEGKIVFGVKPTCQFVTAFERFEPGLCGEEARELEKLRAEETRVVAFRHIDHTTRGSEGHPITIT